jgi:serine/threonine protein kinase
MMEDLIGHTLARGELRLVARLGAGGMGVVYEAEQAALQRRVAVKVLWPHLTQEAGLVGRFNREARIAARLDHPHILPVYGFGEEDGLLYIVVRLVRGGSLKDRLRGEGPRRHGWSAAEALELARQVLPALDYAHRAGVIHRDLKPDNILLEPSDDFPFPPGYRAFVTDFGIATLGQGEDVSLALTQTGAPPGTPAYMAPEQVLERDLDCRTDLYAFGVVLYEVLAGRVPFRGQNPLAVALQHVQQPVPPPRQFNRDLSPAVEGVVLRALAKDPDERFATGAAMLAALAAAAAPAPTLAPQPIPTPEPAPAPPPAPQPATAPERTAEVRAAAEPAPPRRALAAAPFPNQEPPARSVSVRPPPTRPQPAARPAPSASRRGALLPLLGALLLVVAVVGATAWLVQRDRTSAPPPQVLTPGDAAREPAPTAGPATAPDPRPWVVTAADLGPSWSVARESTAGSSDRVRIYEVEYTNSSGEPPRSAGFSLFSATDTATANAGLDQLRRDAEARGATFQPYQLVGDEPSVRGRLSLDAGGPSVSVIHLFRVNLVVAAVEAIGPADREAATSDAAARYAALQRDRLRAAGAS